MSLQLEIQNLLAHFKVQGTTNCQNKTDLGPGWHYASASSTFAYTQCCHSGVQNKKCKKNSFPELMFGTARHWELHSLELLSTQTSAGYNKDNEYLPLSLVIGTVCKAICL